MAIERISPEEALKRMQEEGYAYVDVRTVAEFDEGHPEGAYNIPLGADLVPVMELVFAKDAKLVIGCRSGGRSLRAAGMLQAAGFTTVLDQKAGFHGAHDAFGRAVEPGWLQKGLPAATKPAPGRSWSELLARRGA